MLPATLNAGAHFKVYRQFNRGITYTLKILARASTGSPTASAGIGSTTSSVGASGTQTLSSTGWTELTATWTPTGNTNEAYVYIRSEVATAFTLYIGGVRFYAGTVEPTAHPQSEGRGAFPPFGRVKTMNRDASRSTGWASITELSNDTTLIQTSLTSSAWEMLFDPSLLSSDPFTGEEIQLEIWGRISVNTAPVKIITSVLPQSQVGTSRHTNEYGQLGKIVQPQGSSGLDYRTIRLGTIPVVADPHNPARYRLRVSFSKAGVSSPNVAFEEIYLVQPSRRALGPTGKPNDLAYPRFLPGVSARKRVFSDLSGEAAALNGPAWFPDHGLGGSFIEFEPGDNNLVFLRLNDRVPDDPTTGVAETGSVNAGMVFDVTPRWHLLRD